MHNVKRAQGKLFPCQILNKFGLWKNNLCLVRALKLHFWHQLFAVCSSDSFTAVSLVRSSHELPPQPQPPRRGILLLIYKDLMFVCMFIDRNYLLSRILFAAWICATICYEWSIPWPRCLWLKYTFVPPLSRTCHISYMATANKDGFFTLLAADKTN